MPKMLTNDCDNSKGNDDNDDNDEDHDDDNDNDNNDKDDLFGPANVNNSYYMYTHLCSVSMSKRY